LGKVNKGIVLCYTAFLALWLLLGFVFFVWDNALPAAILDAQGGKTKQLQAEGNGWYVSTGGDAQLIFEDVNLWVRRVVLMCEFANAPGEVDLYYTRRGDEGFSARQRAHGRPLKDGSYEFALPPGQVQDIRIDPGNTGGVRVYILGVEVNPKAGFGSYFEVNLRDVLAFCVLPTLAYLVICTIIDIVQKSGLIKKKKGG
jgi:hypothetical protein